MITQTMLDIAMQELAETRLRASRAKIALYDAIRQDATADYELAPEHAAAEHRRFQTIVRDLEETLRIAGWEVTTAEDRVRNLEAQTRR